MGGMSTQVIWRQQYDTAGDSALRRALATPQREVREPPSHQWDAGAASIGGVRDYQCSYFAPAAAEWSSASQCAHRGEAGGRVVEAHICTVHCIHGVRSSHLGLRAFPFRRDIG